LAGRLVDVISERFHATQNPAQAPRPAAG
jgi:hypothetical protein